MSRAGGKWCTSLTPLYLLTGTLSGQSAASVLHPQQTLPAPGSVPETGPNQLLQPMKPSPSSDNLYSAFTSDGAISVPSLSAPGQGESHEQPPSSESLEMETQPHAGQSLGQAGGLGEQRTWYQPPAAHTVLWAVGGGWQSAWVRSLLPSSGSRFSSRDYSRKCLCDASVQCRTPLGLGAYDLILD